MEYSSDQASLFFIPVEEVDICFLNDKIILLIYRKYN